MSATLLNDIVDSDKIFPFKIILSVQARASFLDSITFSTSRRSFLLLNNNVDSDKVLFVTR